MTYHSQVWDIRFEWTNWYCNLSENYYPILQRRSWSVSVSLLLSLKTAQFLQSAL